LDLQLWAKGGAEQWLLRDITRQGFGLAYRLAERKFETGRCWEKA
jgi:hypothetical protein